MHCSHVFTTRVHGFVTKTKALAREISPANFQFEGEHKKLELLQVDLCLIIRL